MKSLRTFEWRALPFLMKGLIRSGFLALLRRQREDCWLERWLPLIQARTKDSEVLEIGCGDGRDTAIIHRAGLKVKAIDISSAMVKRARVRTPSAIFFVQDLRDPFPIDKTSVVISSLSLHYFSWDETLGIIRRIRAVLQPGGVLLCRLNSTKDVNFGARGHAKIDNDFYLVHGTPIAPLQEAISAGRDLVFDYTPQLYLNLRRQFRQHVVGIFIVPPTLSELINRLSKRGTEQGQELHIKQRMALQDLAYADEHDYHVVNDDFEKTLQTLKCIHTSERCRMSRIIGLQERCQMCRRSQ
ncbi:methyltransferase domain-containing protein [Photorhabdus sp. RM125S]